LWQTYESWARRRQYFAENNNKLPPRGYNDHLMSDSYQPPPGDHLPEVLVAPDPTSGYRASSAAICYRAPRSAAMAAMATGPKDRTNTIFWSNGCCARASQQRSQQRLEDSESVTK
jgi:hypothetical protein